MHAISLCIVVNLLFRHTAKSGFK